MVLYVMQWNIHPDKSDAYTEWTKGAIARTVSAPGVVEFRAYRPATGASQAAITYEFANMTAWETWYAHQDVQDVVTELRTLANNVSSELWGPSPVVPDPIRPGA